jgi:general secretion pathway protein D
MKRSVVAIAAIAAAATALGTSSAAAQQDSLVVLRNDSVTVRLVDADLRLAVQALGQYLNRPVIFGAIGEYRITLATPQPVPRNAVRGLLDGMLHSYGLQLDEQPDYFRIDARQPVMPQQLAMQSAEVQLFVIRLKHASAVDVAATVNALYGQAAALGEPGAVTRGLAASLRENLIPPVQPPTPNQPAPVMPQIARLAGEVTIIPDPRTNSLLIRASARDFELLQAAVGQLDVRPLQVLIEVVIAEVRKDRTKGVGVEAIMPATWVTSTTDTEISAANAGLGLGDFVISVMKLSGVDLALTLRAAASRGDVSILSRPVVLAANNEPAEILVGSQRPFIQVQRALPTDAPVRDQVVQFKDVGTRLTVTPTISEDGYVTLQVAQEVNAATAEVAFDAPVISTRSVHTQLLVKDGQTAVLGGLADRQHDSMKSGVPLLSDVPVIGGLFGKQIRRMSETELFIFITPRVLRTDEDLDAASRGVGDRTNILRKDGGQ